MMFTVVGVPSFSVLWYTWSSIYMSTFNTLPPSHWFSAEAWSFPAWPQLTPRAVTCTAVLPQIRQTFTLFMVFTELLLTRRGGKSHPASLKAIWNHAKTNPHMCWQPALPTQSSTFSLLPVMGNSRFQSYSSKHSDFLTFLLLFLCKI